MTQLANLQTHKTEPAHTPSVSAPVVPPAPTAPQTDSVASLQSRESVDSHPSKSSRSKRAHKDVPKEDSSDYDLSESSSASSRYPKSAKSTLASGCLFCRPHVEETELFRALSGSSSKKIPVESLRQLGWSDARIKAFRNREKNPNQYYYRFNDPGEPQATGKWNAKDKALFLKLIHEKGVDYQVGEADN